MFSSIDDNTLVKELYTKNIKSYYGGTQNIFNSDYYLFDNFQASDDLAALMGSFTAKIFDKTTTLKSKREDIYANVYNDFQIRQDSIQSLLQSSIDRLYQSINDINRAIYILSYIFLAEFFILSCYILFQYYSDSSVYLSLFANHPADDLQSRIKSLERLKIYIETDNKRDLNDVSTYDDLMSFNESKIVNKFVSTKDLLMNFFVKRIAYFSVLLIPALILLSVSFNFSFDNYDVVKRDIDSMIKLDNIVSHTVLIYHQVILSDVYFGGFVSKNAYTATLFEQELQSLTASVSSSQNFEPQVEEMLSESICLHYTPPSDSCNNILNGIATNGIRSFVIYFNSLIENERDFLKGKTYDVGIFYAMIGRQYRTDLYSVIISGLVPTAKFFIEEISDNLLGYLDRELNNMIELFIVSLVIDVFTLLMMIMLVYGVLKRERIMIVNTINYLPLEFILKNKHFKMYFIKESPESQKLFKMTENFRRKVGSMKDLKTSKY